MADALFRRAKVWMGFSNMFLWELTVEVSLSTRSLRLTDLSIGKTYLLNISSVVISPVSKSRPNV
tara:strand:- start:780 stop:974 length:195 start_codon:yes stop_codon:yes gene_type:complete